MKVHVLVLTKYGPQDPVILIAQSLTLLASKFRDYATEHRQCEMTTADSDFWEEIEDIESSIVEGDVHQYPELTMIRSIKYLKMSV